MSVQEEEVVGVIKLTLKGGPRSGEVRDLPVDSTLVFGRDVDCDVQILDSRLSRAHFRLERRPEGVFVHDLNSTNGTFVNGKAVTEAMVIPGDVVTVGSTELFLEESTVAPEPVHTIQDLFTTQTVSRRFEHSTELIPGLIRPDESIESFEQLNHYLRGLVSISSLLNSAKDTRQMLQGVVDIAVESFHADRGCLIATRLGKEERFFSVSDGNGERCRDWELSRTVLDRTLKQGLSTISIDAETDDRFKEGKSVLVQEIKSVLCVPLESDDEVIGAVYLDTVSRIHRFGQREMELLSALGKQAGLALAREMVKEEKDLLFTDTIRAVVAAIEAKDRYLAGHSLRVSEYAETLALALGYNQRFADRLKYAAHLHDVGKIGVSEVILNKPERLTPDEFEVIKAHPVIGAEILEKIQNIEDVILAVRHHHERMDGKGYPDGLKGHDIPLMGRAIAVVDAFDAMTSDRAYRDALGVEAAIAEFRRAAGSQFDPVFSNKMLELILSGQVVPPKSGG